ncbi:MAG: hypothetical protein NTW66_02710 [Candidatus Magasanikbacteria bacterium]|nr:hypothetical protein [Candidatus Magasanikbacteria bacterium]
MTNIIFISLITLALVVIAVIVVRKFPVVANLDLEHLAEEQEIKKKNAILEKRLSEKSNQAQKQFQEKLNPLKRLWALVQYKFRVYVGKIEKLLHYEDLIKNRLKNRELSSIDREKQISTLLQQGESQFHEGNYDKAEEFFIAAIKFDKKLAPAYRGLADTYMAKGAAEEAMQTYDYLSRLTPADDALLVKLSELSEERGKINEAIHYLEKAVSINDSLSPRFYHLAELLQKVDQPEVAIEAVSQAVELESKNPKYLDLLIEIAIICGNRKVADKGFEELRLVNPDNQKLAEFKERIEKIEQM